MMCLRVRGGAQPRFVAANAIAARSRSHQIYLVVAMNVGQATRSSAARQPRLTKLRTIARGEVRRRSVQGFEARPVVIAGRRG